MKKTNQTAIEWLIERVVQSENGRYHIEVPYGDGKIDVTSIIEQAKQMEKNELKKFFNAGFVVQEWDKRKVDLAEQHYNETYKK